MCVGVGVVVVVGGDNGVWTWWAAGVVLEGALTWACMLISAPVCREPRN